MKHERGEGKIGCIISMLVFGTLGAVAYKAIPAYFANSELVDACEFIASSASKKPPELVEKEVKDKARELGIFEVLSNKNAVRVTKTGSGESTNCVITLNYTRSLDFYGAYKWNLVTEKRISKPIFENIS